MTWNEKHLVQVSFEQVKPVGDVAARLFFGCLFEFEPELEELFAGDAEEQGRKLMQIVERAVEGLDRLHELVPRLMALGSRQAAHGIAECDYLSARRAMLWTLERVLGPAFTPEVRESWATVYDLLADTARAGARSAVRVTVPGADRCYLHGW